MAKFKCNNEKCSEFNIIIDIGMFSSYYTEKGVIYTEHKTRNPILCKSCNTALINIPENKGYGSISIFSSLSPERKREEIKKRAQKHLRTNKQDKEYREAAERGEV